MAAIRHNQVHSRICNTDAKYAICRRDLVADPGNPKQLRTTLRTTVLLCLKFRISLDDACRHSHQVDRSEKDGRNIQAWDQAVLVK